MIGVPPAAKKPIVQTEVGAGQEHEKDNDPLDVQAVIMGYAGIFSRETAGGHGAKGVAQGIEKRHAAQHQQAGFNGGEEQIDAPEDFGCFRDARAQAVFGGAGHFRLIELHAADAEQRQDGQREDHNAHAAEPMSHAAPEEQAMGHSLDIAKNGGAGGAEPGHGFKKRVGVGGDGAG
ncbi:MAG: hypothetical protein BWY83_03204 [bacterium ADurb.Bin478]|nr:MAG: hypothetical protein BWY83_03204 [bacterium ADurb.Bin478]